MRVEKIFLIIISTVVCITSFQTCCSVDIVNTSLSCKQTCTTERAGYWGCKNCYPDGYNPLVFKTPRPSLPVKEAHTYVGRIFLPSDPQTPRNCIPAKYKIPNPTKLLKPKNSPHEGFSYYYIAFENKIDVDIVKDTDIDASIKESLNSSLKIPNAQKKAEIIQNLSASITEKLKQNAFTKALFQILTIHPDFIAILDSDETKDIKHPLHKCRSMLENRPNSSFISSVAVITSAGSLSEENWIKLNGIVQTELKNAEIQNFGAVSASVSASISRTISEKIHTETASHASVHGYGFWNLPPKFDPATRVKALNNFRIQNKNLVK